jgi:hypothetical protein
VRTNWLLERQDRTSYELVQECHVAKSRVYRKKRPGVNL